MKLEEGRMYGFDDSNHPRPPSTTTTTTAAATTTTTSVPNTSVLSTIPSSSIKTDNDKTTENKGGTSGDHTLDALCTGLETLKKKELDYELNLLKRNMELIRAII